MESMVSTVYIIYLIYRIYIYLFYLSKVSITSAVCPTVRPSIHPSIQTRNNTIFIAGFSPGWNAVSQAVRTKEKTRVFMLSAPPCSKTIHFVVKRKKEKHLSFKWPHLFRRCHSADLQTPDHKGSQRRFNTFTSQAAKLSVTSWHREEQTPHKC